MTCHVPYGLPRQRPYGLYGLYPPSNTPLEEREKREQTMTIVVEIITNLEVECAQLYTETMGAWTQLSEDKEQQEISQKI
jgi:hypothetical protein